MTIDEAIDIIQSYVPPGEFPYISNTWEALKIGIEALKRIKAQRQHMYKWQIKLLPGETQK